VDEILDNPRQPRLEVDPSALHDLANSIALHGVLQPLLVRKGPAGFELVAGRRRLQAAALAGLDRVPAVVVDVSDQESGLLALIENLQRENLGFLEEAVAYDRMLRDFELTQEELARRLGKSQSSIANKVRLLRLPEEVRQRLRGPAVSERHARALLSLRASRNQVRVLDSIEQRGLTVRQTEVMVERLRAEEDAAAAIERPAAGRAWRGVFRDVRILSNTFKAAVERLREAGLEAEFDEVEREEGLEIKVLVKLPEGWREGGRKERAPQG
jgi:ParB family chromosome partitioning protein